MLQVRQLEKIIESRSALSIDQLDVAAGEVVAVVGPVSSGKTLLIRLLCGEVMPSGGKVLLDGQDIHLVRAAPPPLRAPFSQDLLYNHPSPLTNFTSYSH